MSRAWGVEVLVEVRDILPSPRLFRWNSKWPPVAGSAPPCSESRVNEAAVNAATGRRDAVVLAAEGERTFDPCPSGGHGRGAGFSGSALAGAKGDAAAACSSRARRSRRTSRWRHRRMCKVIVPGAAAARRRGGGGGRDAGVGARRAGKLALRGRPGGMSRNAGVARRDAKTNRWSPPPAASQRAQNGRTRSTSTPVEASFHRLEATIARKGLPRAQSHQWQRQRAAQSLKRQRAAPPP